ncbi:hypothetical protein pb186bvf_007082 [Paramecium bursaria]
MSGGIPKKSWAQIAEEEDELELMTNYQRRLISLVEAQEGLIDIGIKGYPKRATTQDLIDSLPCNVKECQIVREHCMFKVTKTYAIELIANNLKIKVKNYQLPVVIQPIWRF